MKVFAVVALALVAAMGAANADSTTGVGHPVQFIRDGSFDDSAGSLRRVKGDAEDIIYFPTPKPTTLATPAPTVAGSAATPAPTVGSHHAVTPAPTTVSDGSTDENVGQLGVAYSVTRDEVESSSSYTVPVAVAGCVAAVAAVAGVAFVVRKRKQRAQGGGADDDVDDDIATPVATPAATGAAQYNDDIATPVASNSTSPQYTVTVITPAA